MSKKPEPTEKDFRAYTSKVYLISQAAGGPGNTGRGEVTKQQLDVQGVSGDVFFPVGYVIDHEGGSYSYQVYDDSGFDEMIDVIAYPIYQGTQISKLEGELLTIVDASIVDGNQRESLKSLIRQTLWRYNGNQENKIRAMYESLR